MQEERNGRRLGRRGRSTGGGCSRRLTGRPPVVKWLYVVCGATSVLIGLYSVVWQTVSERRRHEANAIGHPQWFAATPIVGGILFVIGGFSGQLWVALLGFVAMYGCAWLSRRFIQQVEDPPPIFGYLDKQSLSPLVTMRHPIRETRLGLRGLQGPAELPRASGMAKTQGPPIAACVA